MKHKNFGVLILSRGRADIMKTVRTLEVGGYTGPWWIVIDNEDNTAPEYYEKYGDHIVMFDKVAASKKFDIGDNFSDRRVVVIARNIAYDIAKQLGLAYFLELDDDYSGFYIRYKTETQLAHKKVTNLDAVFDLMLDFLDETGAMTVAFAQGGDLIGGKDNGNIEKGILRKAMNTFFCRTDRPFPFLGRLNEDVTTYVKLGSEGKLFFTVCDIEVNQIKTQKQKGGLTDAYLDGGTYFKSFYSVMYSPSCVSVGMMGEQYLRIHHSISWRNAVPKILSEEWRKE